MANACFRVVVEDVHMGERLREWVRAVADDVRIGKAVLLEHV